MAFNSSDKDDFWDIQKLMPTRKQNSTQKPIYRPDIVTPKEHSIPGNSTDGENSKLTLTSNEKKTVTYLPHNRFVKKITVTDYPAGFDFHGAFRNAALLYFDFKAPKCDFVGFYSYMPQYIQLNTEQKAFYFYFRSEVRRKNYVKTDYSYLYLYVYEIINLPDKIPAREGLEILCDLWCAYRDMLPKIDEKFVIWVRDYCIIHRLEAPIDKIGHFIFDIVTDVPLCEFYLTGFDKNGRVPSSVICSYLSGYDWRKGKYAGGESAKIYEKLMLGALDELMGYMWRYGKIGNELLETKAVSFTSFAGCLCTQAVKKNITVEYSPLSAGAQVRADITDAVRYTENKLRALLGIKSRLLIKSQKEEYRKIIDGYFDRVIKKEIAQKRSENIPEYEKLYVAESAELSSVGADEIERISWSTTVRLTEGSEDAPIFEAKNEEKCENTEQKSESIPLLSTEELSSIKASLSGGVLSDLPLAEKINEIFLERIGDVAYESAGDSFVLIEDYREDVENWLMNFRT